MKARKPALYAIGISVTAHIFFFLFAAGVKMPGVYTTLKRSKRMFNIKALEKEIPPERRETKRATYSQVLKFESPVYSESVVSRIEAEEEMLEKEALRMREEKIREPVRPSFKEDLSDIAGEGDHEALKERAQRLTRKELVKVDGVSGERVPVGPRDFLEPAELPSDFYDKMPGFTPEMRGGFFETIKENVISRFARERSAAIGRKTDFSDINQYLRCALSTYEDPEDGKKYFKISIKAGKAAMDLPQLPKEMVFLIDSSLSIKPAKLREFKKGLRYALDRLNPEDRFNIMTFKEKIVWFKPESVKPSKANINEALGFVDRLTAGERTDVYNALYKAIRSESAVKPSYIILFSDGHPTRGVTNPRRIISEISRQNAGERPIFAFGGGIEVNRYLLDFISYKNRGWTEYAYHTNLVGKNISLMCEKIRDPLLLNVRYRISELDTGEMFPKTLPDFFKAAEFTLFGRYADEDEFSLQFLGDSNAQTSEFIAVGSLKNAAKGGEEIARDWAFNKIYHLIGLLAYGKNQEKIIDEIDALSKKFGITTPYSDGIRVKARK